jgi:membrane protease YdiL (CAAX protease family)
VSALVKKHPALSILVLSLILGLTPVLLVLAGVLPGGFLQLGAVSGSLAGIILAAIAGGKDGLRELLRRVLIWRVGIQWWAFALLSFVPLIVVALYLYDLFGGPAVDWSGVGPLTSFVPLLLFLVVFAGFGEEFGWRGFLLPRLQAATTRCSRPSSLGRCGPCGTAYCSLLRERASTSGRKKLVSSPLTLFTLWP